MINFMSKENEQLYWFLLHKKLRFWKDRHLRKLKRMIEYRYERKYYYMPNFDLRIEFQKRICELSGWK